MFYWLESCVTDKNFGTIDEILFKEIQEKDYITIFVANLDKDDKVEAQIKELSHKMTSIDIFVKNKNVSYNLTVNGSFDYNNIEKGRIGDSIRYFRIRRKEETSKKIKIDI